MARRPNLVFIFSDRQRFDTMRCYGNDWIKTPNLNALADQSLVFENTYVTQPVCAPARSSIMTGLYPHAAEMPRNKLVLPQGAKTIAEMASADYRRAYFGKWHLGDEVVRQHGFDEWVSIIDAMWEQYTKEEYRSRSSDYHQFLLQNGFEPDENTPVGKLFSDQMRYRLPPEYHMASFLADRAAAFIEENRDRPFILYVAFLEPHPPFTGPFNHLYDPEEMPVEPTFLKKPEGASLFNRARADFYNQIEFDGHDLSTEAGWRRLRANYLGNVTLVDNAVGKIVGAVDGAGLADDTIVLFTSEHGDLVGTHAMLEMRTFYEEAAKVPLMMRIPWLTGEQRMIGGNFGQIDLVPTLLDLLGEPIPKHLQGQSRAAVLRGEATLEGNDVFIQHNGIGDRDLGKSQSSTMRMLGGLSSETINLLCTLPWRSVVTGDRWKLNLCAGDQCELFDLNTDRYEERNLFNDPAQKDRIRSMAARIRLWQHHTGDDAPLPSV